MGKAQDGADVTFTATLWPPSWDAAANFYLLLCAGFLCFVARDGGVHFGTLPTYLSHINLWGAVFVAVLLLAHRFSTHLHPAYVELSPRAKWLWANRVMSTVHACIVAPMAFVALLDPSLREDIVETWTPLVAQTTCIFMGYTFVDSYFTLKFSEGGIFAALPMIIHHVMVLGICISGVSPVTHTRFGMAAACMLVNEFSTPFMNNIFFFKDCRVGKDSVFVLYNSLLFSLTFFLCRIVLLCYVLYRLFEPTSHMYKYSTVQIGCMDGFGILFLLLNGFWFTKIVGTAYAMLTKKGKSARSEDEASNLLLPLQEEGKYATVAGTGELRNRAGANAEESDWCK